MKTNKRIEGLVNNGWFILGCNLCSIIGLIVSFITENPILKTILFIITCLIVGYMILYLFYRLFNLRRAKLNIHKKNMAINQKTFLHLRSFYEDLLNYISFLRQYNNISQNTFQDKAQLLCTRIEQIFTVALDTQDPVSVCIKCFKIESILNKNILDAEIFTLARSSSTHPNRKKYDTTTDKIIENTDFEIIVSNDRLFGNIDSFVCEDLDSYPQKFQSEYKKYLKTLIQIHLTNQQL